MSAGLLEVEIVLCGAAVEEAHIKVAPVSLLKVGGRPAEGCCGQVAGQDSQRALKEF